MSQPSETVTVRESSEATTVRQLSFLDSAGGHIVVGFLLLLLAIGVYILIDWIEPSENIKGALIVLCGGIATIATDVFRRALAKAGDDQ